MSVADVRRERGVTQVELARTLGSSQRAVSHVEHEPNPRVATLAGYLGALGGRLRLQAIFDDRVVALELPQAPATGTARARVGRRPDGAPRRG
jgi:transcriptional regulator with XRE-family HTH domain